MIYYESIENDEINGCGGDVLKKCFVFIKMIV